MAPTVFVAVQCCQCSTMQVKQEKRSSNKWSCVICHQKQSVRKVFARSLLAREVRLVVQQFNMSRQSAEAGAPPPLPEVALPEVPLFAEFGAKRTDWTEYLDDPGDGKEIEGAESDGQMEVATELSHPNQVFGKMRVRGNTNSAISNRSLNSKEAVGGTRLFRPTFGKRKDNLVYPKDSKRTNHSLVTQQASKWSHYLEEDRKLIETDSWGEDNDNLVQGGLNGERVKEDVHPDFI